MKVTVVLNELADAACANLGQLLSSEAGVKVLKVFGRGRYASIETSQAQLDRLRERFGDSCRFTRTLEAQPFERL